MRLFHEQIMSRLAELERTARAQGVNLFAKKRTAVMPEAPMSSDSIDFAQD
jgi:hypothetical protein